MCMLSVPSLRSLRGAEPGLQMIQKTLSAGERYVIFYTWIQWGDKCKPVFYFHVAAVFLTTVYQGFSDRDRKSRVVRCSYLYARSLSAILSERWLMPSALSAQGSFIALKWLRVWVLSAGALPMSIRPLIQWCFEACAKSGVCKQPHQLVAQLSVANSTKPASWTNRRPSGRCGAWSCAKPVQQQLLLLF